MVLTLDRVLLTDPKWHNHSLVHLALLYYYTTHTRVYYYCVYYYRLYYYALYYYCYYYCIRYTVRFWLLRFTVKSF